MRTLLFGHHLQRIQLLSLDLSTIRGTFLTMPLGTPSNRTDEDIVKAYQDAKDKNLLAPLFKKYIDSLVGLAYYYISDRESSKDIVMEVYETILRQIDSKEITNFKGWAMSMCRKKCLKYLRDKKQITELSNIPEIFVESEEEVEYIDEHVEKLRESIEKLKDDQRICVEAFFLQGKSYKDLEEELGMEYKQIKTHIQNGKRNLKILMTA